MIRLNTKHLIVFFTILFSINAFSQEDKSQKDEDYEEIKKSMMSMLLSSVIEMDIDKSIFPVSQGNSHFTEDKKSGIVAMLMPSPFDNLEEDLKKEESKDGALIIDKGELKNEGKRILFLKQSIEQEGEVYYMLMFAKEYTDEATIMVTAFYKSSEDDDYVKYSERAVKSAKIVEKE